VPRTALEVRHEAALALLQRGEIDAYEALCLVCWPPKGSRLETAQPPYIDVRGKHIWGVTERARRELGTWPSATSIVDALAVAFAQAAEAEKEPAKKNRLRVVADGLGGAVKDIAVAVVAKHLGDL
jgi:hypothetical protein